MNSRSKICHGLPAHRQIFFVPSSEGSEQETFRAMLVKPWSPMTKERACIRTQSHPRLKPGAFKFAIRCVLKVRQKVELGFVPQ